MRILIYAHEFPPHSGGIATYNTELANGLSAQGHKVLVLAPKYSARENTEQSGEKYRVWRTFPNKGFKPYKILASTVSLIWCWFRFHPDVILATNAGSQRCAAIASLLFPIPYVLVVHGKEIRELFKNDRLLIIFFRNLIRRGFFRAKAIIAVSEVSRNTLLSVMPELEKKTHIVYFGIESPFQAAIEEKEVEDLRKHLHLASEDKIILTVARLTPGKGQDLVIHSLPKVLEKMPNTKYLVVGDGECAAELKSLAQVLGVESAVRFVGNVPRRQIWGYYKLCDVFVMPSRLDENFGLVFIEAASVSKPVIGGTQSGMKEAVLNRETGILVNPDSIEEITDAIIYLLTHPEIASQMGRHGRDRFNECFTIQAMIEKTLDVLRGVADVN